MPDRLSDLEQIAAREEAAGNKDVAETCRWAIEEIERLKNGLIMIQETIAPECEWDREESGDVVAVNRQAWLYVAISSILVEVRRDD